MVLLEKDCYKDLTAKDFIESGLMVGIDKDSLEELEYGQQLNKRINKMLKGWLIIQERERVKKNYQEVGDDGLITTDWLETEIEGIRIIGDRTVAAKPGVEEDPKKEWFFRINSKEPTLIYMGDEFTNLFFDSISRNRLFLYFIFKPCVIALAFDIFDI